MSYGFFQTGSGTQTPPTPPTIIWYEVTRAAALALIAASTVVKGAGYLITDKSIVLYGDDENAFKLEGSLIINTTTQDVVHYDIVNDLIVYREDKNGNKVTCNTGIFPFPFNTPTVYGNVIIGRCNVIGINIFNNEVICVDNQTSSIVNNGAFVGNKVTASVFAFENNAQAVSYNEFTGQIFNIKGSPNDIVLNKIKCKNSFNFQNTGINTSFIMRESTINCESVIVDMTGNWRGFLNCNISCKILDVKIVNNDEFGINHISNRDFVLRDYQAIDNPLADFDTEFFYFGHNFSLGTRIEVCVPSSINAITGRSVLTPIGLNGFKEASVLAWTDTGFPTPPEYITGVDPTQLSDAKNIKIWNRTQSAKYIVLEKSNGAPFYKGQFFSENEAVITLNSNEYAEFQLCSTYKEVLTDDYYQLISHPPQKTKTETTFEGVGLRNLRMLQSPLTSSITTINPSVLAPFTKASLNLTATNGGYLILNDSNNTSTPAISTSTLEPKVLSITAQFQNIVPLVVSQIGFMSDNNGGGFIAGEGLVGFSNTSGTLTMSAFETGNAYAPAFILPAFSVATDLNYHDYTIIITNNRFIFMFDNKIVQVSSNIPAIPFNFARGVRLSRSVTPDAFSIFLKNITYKNL